MLDVVFSSLANLWSGFSGWSVPPLGFYGIMASSILSALLFSRFSGGIPLVTIPASFAVFMYCGRLACYLFWDIDFSITDAFQKGAALSVAGQFLGGLVLLSLFGVKEMRAGARL